MIHYFLCKLLTAYIEMESHIISFIQYKDIKSGLRDMADPYRSYPEYFPVFLIACIVSKCYL